MVTRVSDILREKGREVLTVRQADTVGTVAGLLSARRVGAVPVLATDGGIAGMISERDLVRSLAEHGEHALSLPVADFMTRTVETCAETDSVIELMQVMTRHRIRHLPVLSNGMLAGIISIGDVVKERLAEAQAELDAMREFIAS